jgi:hypothetical protein
VVALRASFVRSDPKALILTARSLAAAAACVALCGTASAQLPQPLAASSFEGGAEGWSVIATQQPKKGKTLGLLFKATGGNVGGVGSGFLSTTDPGRGITYWRASAEFVGEKAAALGGTLSFDLMQSSADAQVKSPDVVLVGANGLELVYTLPKHPSSRWTRYHVLLDGRAGWRVKTPAGAPATAEQMGAVLGNIADLRVRAEFRSGPDTSGLDNVRLEAPRVAAPFSRFDNGDEGWFVLSDAHAPVWSPASAGGGNPGGALMVRDRGDGPFFLYQAPAKFLGDRSSAYGQTLSFDLKTTFNEHRATGMADVVLSGAGFTLVYDAPSNPGTSWTRFEVPLSEAGGWRVGTVRGPVPTAAQFRAVLGAVTGLAIRGEFSGRLDTGMLDNVFFGTPCLADFDQNGIVNPDDLADFVTLYFNPGVYGDGRTADHSGDGLTNPDDLADYIRVYFNGCD